MGYLPEIGTLQREKGGNHESAKGRKHEKLRGNDIGQSPEGLSACLWFFPVFVPSCFRVFVILLLLVGRWHPVSLLRPPKSSQ
jgi:hypothetical protein